MPKPNQEPTKILRRPEVQARTGRSRSAIYKGMDDGSFPQAVKIGQRAVGWVESEVQNWIDVQVERSRSTA